VNIGEIAVRTGLPAKTIRYYEGMGLIAPPRRSGGNYRVYDDRDLETLLFIQQARQLGFPIKEVAGLLQLWRDQGRSSADVHRLAVERMHQIDSKIAELQRMRRTLETLVERCHGDERPDCPILDKLAGGNIG